MANADNPRGFDAATNLYGGAIPSWEGLLKSNNLVAVGDVLFATAGYVTTTETSDKAPVGISLTSQLTSTTVNVSCLFAPNLDGIVFRAQEDGTPTQATVWTIKDYVGTRGNSTGISSQEIDTTGGDSTLITIGFSGETSIGANAVTLCQFLKSKFTGKCSSTFVAN